MDDLWCGMEANDVGLQTALPDAFWPQFIDCASSFTANDSACFGAEDDVNLMNLANKVDMEGMEMDTIGFFGEEGHLMPQEPIHSLSSLSSKRSLSMDSGNSSPSFPFDGAAVAATNPVSHATSAPLPHPLAGVDGDEAAITRAMMAVLSSSATSSSSSSPPSFAVSPLHHHGANGQVKACMPYQHNSTSCELKDGDGDGHGQDLVKNSLARPEKTAASSVDGGGGGQEQEETRTASSNQVYHMMSERKRREKLNESFQTLRSLIPACSKKDKTTVLMNATKYLKTLAAQVSELEEKNSMLERCIPSNSQDASCSKADNTGGAGRTPATHQRAKVHITRAFPSSSSAPAPAQQQQQISLRVAVMVECDIVELILNILECIRWMKEISILSVDANTYSPQMQTQAIATIKLQIMDGDWNESMFHEAMTKAANDATSSSSCTPHARIQSLPTISEL